MPVKVVDASAIAALLFGEPETDAIAAQLADNRLAAPGLLPFELANVCLIKCRRHPEQRSGLMASFRLYDQFGIDIVAVHPSLASGNQTKQRQVPNTCSPQLPLIRPQGGDYLPSETGYGRYAHRSVSLLQDSR